jgi:hypothetical protein
MMNEQQKQAIQDALDALTEKINAVVGCALFAPEGSRKQDLPSLVDALREAEEAMQEALEAAGLKD